MANVHHGHVRRHDRKTLEELADLLAEVADVTDVRQLTRARDSVNLDERMHQRQHKTSQTFDFGKQLSILFNCSNVKAVIVKFSMARIPLLV